MSNDISKAITDAALRRLAGEQSYTRGFDYFSHGHVQSLEDQGDRGIGAVVRGAQLYSVTLTIDDGMLDYSCECPVGSDGDFCKHRVAASLAWRSRTAAPAKSAKRGKPKEVTLASAGKLLQSEEKETLVRMLLDWAKDDRQLRERVILYAARRSGPDTRVAAVQKAFENAVRVRGYLGYREADGWARGVDGAIDSIEQLLNDGQAAAVVGSCEVALYSLVGAIGSVDDSNGHFADLRDRLQDLHHQACREARPEPTELAKRLFLVELNSDFDVFYGAVQHYAEILGPKGMKAYRDLSENVWAKVPQRTNRNERSEWGSHFRITKIMESLAKASGDIEELVSVLSRDLSLAYHFYTIAEVYREAKDHDNALIWAEKGLKAFPQNTDPRLREFAAQEYHRRRRHGDARKLLWAAFSERPFLEEYKALEKHAKTASAWPEWRERALEDLRRRVAEAKRKSRGRARYLWVERDDDHSRLVEILLYERKPEEAWREAIDGGCSDRLWLRLAAVREKEHPEDAAPIYLKYARAAVDAVSNGRYEDSVELLVKAAAAMKRLDQSAEFARQLDALRVTYKAKRNFIKLVEQQRKSLYLD